MRPRRAGLCRGSLVRPCAETSCSLVGPSAWSRSLYVKPMGRDLLQKPCATSPCRAASGPRVRSHRTTRSFKQCDCMKPARPACHSLSILMSAATAGNNYSYNVFPKSPLVSVITLGIRKQESIKCQNTMANTMSARILKESAKRLWGDVFISSSRCPGPSLRMHADIAFAIACAIHGFLFSNPKGGIPNDLTF